jgi:hypothetical protein
VRLAETEQVRLTISSRQCNGLLGHASVQTTERYLGTKQDLVHAPNDAIKPQLATGVNAWRASLVEH